MSGHGTWGWGWFCILGLHWLCDAEWDVMGGRQTCSCDKGDQKPNGRSRHRRVHTNTFAWYNAAKVKR